MQTVTVKFVQTAFVLATFVHAVTYLIFGQNFKCRFLGPPLTDANCHRDICPGNICPYQEYLSFQWHWPNFDQTFCTQTFLDLNFYGPKYNLDHSFFHPKFFWNQKLFWPEIFDQILLDQNYFWSQDFFSKNILDKIL